LALASCAASPPAPAQAQATSTAPAPTAAASAPASGAAPDDATLQAFARWVAEFREHARSEGIDEATLRIAFDDVRYLPRVVQRDDSQPELVRTVWDYLDRALSAERLATGREKLAQVRAEADAAAARYGVPPEVLVAIWGLESNYGGNVGSMPIIDALATLGFQGRREAWARRQLLAALQILQAGDIDRARLVGSWAGAMGQTQFLPTSFLAYAVDGDGDGRRDIWGSLADVMASTAHFLARAGWQAGQPWGLEVRLPADFDPERADAQVRQASEAWAAEGVRSAMDGAALPALADAAVLRPAGVRGPAFLVGPNFRALLRYNNSNSYALAVGLLAQHLAGGPPGVLATWPRELAALTRSQLQALQAALNERGFESGTPDGLMGPATRAGIRRYQRSIGLPADGYPTLELLQRLQQER
jgi:lytic murein transglycosylase